MQPTTAELVVPSAGGGEDRAAVLATDDGVVLVVADGAGGTGGGAEAAERVIDAVRRAAAASGLALRDPCSLLRAIDRDLAPRGGEATAVIAIASTSRLVGASVGDSAAWQVRRDGHLDLTSDQVRKPLLGSVSARPVRFDLDDLEGTLVVATDGLFKYAKAKDICEVVRGSHLASVPEGLVRLVRMRSGALRDDVAIVVCRVSS